VLILPHDCPVVGRVIVICAELNFVASAVEVAEIVAIPAPLLAGANVVAVPDFTPEVALKVPADAGLTDMLTVLVNAPVPATVGVHVVVSTFVIDAGLHTTATPVIVGAGGVVIVIVAVPDLVGSALEVALMTSDPEAGTFAGAAYNPTLEIVPDVADQETSEV
jgi:hypothetical protein